MNTSPLSRRRAPAGVSPARRAIETQTARRLAGPSLMRLAAGSALALLLALAAPGPSSAAGPVEAGGPERHALEGGAISIYNLAGAVSVEPTEGEKVIVEVLAAGRDAGRLRVRTGPIGSRQTLRVVYPGTRVVYRESGHSGKTQIRVREDGSFGGNGSWSLWSGRTVTVAGSGGGLEAWADLRVLVPRGRDVEVYLGVGAVKAAKVDAKLRLDTASGPVSTTDTRGALVVDVGSGRVSVTGATGPLTVDTGSGGVVAEGVSGGPISIDTGSGAVSGRNLRVHRLRVDTGSGGVTLREVGADTVEIDTGSGHVEVDLASAPGSLVVDTGSGAVSVTVPPDLGAKLLLDTGSGGIDVDLPLTQVRRDGGEMSAQLGDGRGRITIDTGSGGIRIGPR